MCRIRTRCSEVARGAGDRAGKAQDLAVGTVVPSIWDRLRKRRHSGIVRTRAVNDRGQCTWRDERKWREKANVPFHLAFTLCDIGERTNAARCVIGVAADNAALVENADVDETIGAAEVAAARTGGSAAQLRGSAPDPWQSLMQVGAQFIAALAAANDSDAAEHPWIERNPATGAQSLKIPLPPPETARHLANVLSALVFVETTDPVNRGRIFRRLLLNQRMRPID